MCGTCGKGTHRQRTNTRDNKKSSPRRVLTHALVESNQTEFIVETASKLVERF